MEKKEILDKIGKLQMELTNLRTLVEEPERTLDRLPLENVSGDECKKWRDLYPGKLEFKFIYNGNWRDDDYFNYVNTTSYSIRVKEKKLTYITAENFREHLGKAVWNWHSDVKKAIEGTLIYFINDEHQILSVTKQKNIIIFKQATLENPNET
jgi:hypothetical protein